MSNLKSTRVPTPLLYFFWGVSGLAVQSCAGPVTPLGAVNSLLPPNDSVDTPTTPIEIRGLAHQTPKIRLSPERQMFHEKSNFTIHIQDAFWRKSDVTLLSDAHLEQIRNWISDPAHLTVYYDGIDITESFFLQSETKWNNTKNEIDINYGNLYLSPGSGHRIRIDYASPNGSISSKDYGQPFCITSADDPISGESLSSFNISPGILRAIQLNSSKNNFNPSLLAALIAQESGFNPKAVSWAKAVGLTQMTPIAEAEIIGRFPEWPRYPNFNSRSAIGMKSLILNRKANSTNEWRLNPTLSIRGGLEYVSILEEKWNDQKLNDFISEFPGNPEVHRSQLVLASYNSGMTRVKRALKRKGERWLEDRSLTAARHYVNNIMSLCYHQKDNSKE